jgi:hypothetical protein
MTAALGAPPWLPPAPRCQGAQERLVPVRNGSFPEAPAGGHRSHVGALLDAVPVALPDEPPELVALPADPPELAEETALDEVRPLDAAPVDAVPVPAIVVPVAPEDVDCAVAAEVVFAPLVAAVETVALLPSVTTPLFVTRYGFAVVVCAVAGAIAAKKNSTA